MTDKKPEALRLADTLDLAPENGIEPQTSEDAAAELRRLHTENTALQQGYAAARLEIESMAEEHADELMVAHLDGRMRAAQQPGVATWTPLPGTLPEPGKPVLLDIGKEYPIRAMWAAKHTLEVGMDDDSGFGEYDETTDTYYCPEGWYEWNEHEDVHWRVDKTPTAWCELPQNGGASHGQAPAQPAPQQDAQEPVAWYVTGCGRLLDEDEAKAEARHIGGSARAIPLYTAPQADIHPAPVRDEELAELLDLLTNKTAFPTYYFNHKSLYECCDCASEHEDYAEIEHADTCASNKAFADRKKIAELIATLRNRAARAPADSGVARVGMGVAHTLSDAQIEAMPVWRNFVGLWPESRREIVDAVADLLATPPAQAADSVLEDAARLDWLLLHISGAEFRRIGVHYSGNARRADVDAARAAQEGN